MLTTIPLVRQTGKIVQDYIVSGSSTNTITIQNLDINTHKKYYIVADIYNPTGVQLFYCMYINQHFTNSSYQYSPMVSNPAGGAPSAGFSGSGYPLFESVAPSSQSLCIIDLELQNSYPTSTILISELYTGNTPMYIENWATWCNQTFANVTRLDFKTYRTDMVTAENGFIIGSRITIYGGE